MTIRKKKASNTVTFIVLAIIGLLVCGCSRTEMEIVAAPVFELPSGGGELYTRILPKIQDLASAGTKVIRVDGPRTIMMRFSVGEADQSLRLVEIRFTESAEHMTEVSVVSRRFTFVPGDPSRDATDVSLERRVADVIRKQAGTATTSAGGRLSPSSD